MESDARFPRAQAFDTEYWLCRCEGFAVDSPTGRVGVVEGLRYRTRLERPDELAVRVGRFGRRHLLVSISQVAEIAPRKSVIVLRAVPNGARGGSGRMLSGGSWLRGLRRVTSGSRYERTG